MNPTFLILPVHNRRAVTLRCLDQLRRTDVLSWTQVLVVDDGSTDGTGDAVRAEFPGVRVVPGNGNLWWGGAIRLGMDTAMQSGAGFLVWLNDDCQPDPGTVRLLVDHAARTGRMAAGWARTPGGGRYVGYRKTWRGLRPVGPPPAGDAVACDAAAGNCVAIPRAVVEAIGLPDAARLPHALLDVDYLLSATRRGFGLDLLGSATCRNDDNLGAATSSWLLADASPMRQWKIFLGPRSTHGYRSSSRFYFKHWGIRGGWLFARAYLKLAVICVVRAVVPVRVLRAAFGRKSAAWRQQSFHRRAAEVTSPAPGQPGSP